jgi:hypothetical protein
MFKILFLSFLFIGSSYAQECSQEEYLQIITADFFNDFETVNKDLEQNVKLCTMFRYYKSKNVPTRALRQALNYYSKNYKSLKNQRYISIADYSQNSKKERFYLLDLEKGIVKTYKVSHGSGSRGGKKAGGTNKDLKSCKHSDGKRTNMTRPGFFKTANLYKSTGVCDPKKSKSLRVWRSKSSKWKKKCSHDDFIAKNGELKWGWPDLPDQKNNAMRIHGLNRGINDKAFSNGVVMHGAWYNTDQTQKINGGAMGRSYGCPAFKPSDNSEILPKIKGGSLYYSYVEGKCDLDMKVINKQNPGWKGFCSDN